MRIFKCDENIKSYTFPVSKIVLCCLLITLIVNRGYFLHVSSPFWRAFIGIICLLVVILAILCIYLSIAEMLLLKERRDKSNVDIKTALAYSKNFSVDHIISLLESNDIIEISIISDNQIIRLGASSDSRPGCSRLLDKHYYVNGRDNITIDELREATNNCSNDSKICVIAIDGVPPNSY